MWLDLQRLARRDVEELSHAELRELEYYPDPGIAAGAVDELNRRSNETSTSTSDDRAGAGDPSDSPGVVL